MDGADVSRKDVLKAVAAPLVVAAAGGLKTSAMTTRPLMTVRLTAAEPQKLGTVPHGVRSVVPVTGGDFEGPRLRGKVLSGGGDWLLLRADGVLELDLRITLETDDRALST